MSWLVHAIACFMRLFVVLFCYKFILSSLACILDVAVMKLLEEVLLVLNENRRPNWIDLHNFRIIKYGALLHIDCHLTVPWYLNMHEAHLEIDELEILIKNKFGDAIELFVHTDGCLPFSCTICTKTDCPVRQQPMKGRLNWTMKNIISNEKHRI
jgi:divalent metal cation (Fe/Co/Zn/Cd) transporter